MTASPGSDDNEKAPVWQTVLIALAWCLGGAFVQIWNLVHGCAVSLLARRAGRTASERARALGEAIIAKEIPALLQLQLGLKNISAELERTDLSPEDRNRKEQEKRDQALRLGQQALYTTVPIVGVKEAYDPADQARRTYERLKAQAKDIFQRAWPASIPRRLGIVISYLFLVALVVSVIAFLSPRKSPPPPPPTDVVIAVPDGEVHVKVVSAQITRQLPGQPRDKPEPDDHLLLVVEISNPTKGKVVYRTWRERAQAPKEVAKAVDQTGKQLDPLTLPKTDKMVETSTEMGANESVQDTLHFAAPRENNPSVELYLPGENVGGSGTVRLRIPAELLQRDAATGK